MFTKKNSNNTPVGEVYFDWDCGNIITVTGNTANQFLSAIEEAMDNDELHGYKAFNNANLEKKAEKIVARFHKQMA